MSEVTKLFEGARQDGTLSMPAYDALNVIDLGAEIQAGLGISVDDVQSSEVVLISQMPDDSGSIKHGNNEALVCEGHNLVLQSLAESKQKENILAHTRYLNGHVLFPYCPIGQIVKMDSGNYSPNLGTPLYDQAVVLLGTVLAKAQQFSDNGVPVRTVTLIITDGADVGSTRSKPSDVAAIVTDMLKSEHHIIAAMGIDDGVTNFKKVFKSMGIRDEWILTPGNSPSDIRKAFQVVSQSAMRASQNAGSFSKLSQNGFAN